MQWVCNPAPKRRCLIAFQSLAPLKWGVSHLCHQLPTLDANLSGTHNYPFIHSFLLSKKYSE